MRNGTPLRKIFSEIIATEMEKQGVTQAQLAKHLTYNISTVNNIVNGRRNVSLDVVDEILTFLKVDIGHRSYADQGVP